MTHRCPGCGSEISPSFVEGLRKPFISHTTTFQCPSCSANISIDYWPYKINAFRLVFACGGVVLFYVLSLFAVSLPSALVAGVTYVFLGWFILNRIRGLVLMKRQPFQGGSNGQA